MWDFSFRTALSLVAATFPFIVLRLAVYLAIAAGYTLSTGIGIGTGWTLGRAYGGLEMQGGAIGGLAGFFLVAGFLWWARQYLLYVVKAGHVAALDARLRGLDLPGGQGQIAYATTLVKARFLEVNLLFGLDLMVRGVIGVLVGLGGLLSFWIPDGGQMSRLLRAVLRVSLGLVDEVVLAYILREDRSPPAASARDALVLYAQNAGMLLKNGVWIALFQHAVTVAIFLALLSPAVALAYVMPGGFSGFGVVFALVLAWSLKQALIEPIAMACLLLAYYRAIEGQRPDPEWTARLDRASAAFRDLAGHGSRPPRATEASMS